MIKLLTVIFFTSTCAILTTASPFAALAMSNGLFGKRAATTQTPKVQTMYNGTRYLWLLDDTFQGDTFFDEWDFYTGSDPTHGSVTYVNASTAIATNLTYIQSDGIVIMKSDNTTWLPSGGYRNSVRISSRKQYNTGLFILDLNQAPWGCGIWPAFWTLGGGQWPYTGEIDVLEGVHDNEHNQVSWHTNAGCNITPKPSNYTGTTIVSEDCDSTNGKSGCGIIEYSRASYGPYFDSQGGGVFAMKWDADSIAVWNFYRNAVPADIVAGVPNPLAWGLPSAMLSPMGCDLIKNFVNHSMIFDITFCGDWAGSSYSSTRCPGSCADNMMNPANFINASWSINWLKTYKQTRFNSEIVAPTSGSSRTSSSSLIGLWTVFGAVLSVVALSR